MRTLSGAVTLLLFTLGAASADGAGSTPLSVVSPCYGVLQAVHAGKGEAWVALCRRTMVRNGTLFRDASTICRRHYELCLRDPSGGAPFGGNRF